MICGRFTPTAGFLAVFIALFVAVLGMRLLP